MARDAHFLLLGQIHPYHRIGEFVDTLISQGNTRPVIVAGAVGDQDLLRELEAHAAEHSWLSIRPGFLPEEQVTELVETAAATVSLQRNPFNSGAGPFALPRHLPLAMSAAAQTEMLQKIAGSEWVYAIPEDLGQLSLAELESWLHLGRTAPDLTEFTLQKVAQTHVALYNSLRR